MAEEKKEPAKQNNNEDAAIKPDEETTQTTDPQEHMKGPLSSLMGEIEDAAEKKGSESPGGKDAE